MSREMKIQEDITRNQHRLTNHLIKQNKRYRKALEIAKNEMEVHFKLSGTDNAAYATICNALKEEKNE